MTSYNFNNRFKYPVLTRVTEPLSFQKLNKLKNQLKTNASSIQSHLGGAINGHLGLITTTLEYTTIDATSYIWHVNPPPLNSPRNTQQHEANREREDHKEQRLLFWEQVALEKTLLKLMSDALPNIYLLPFRNDESNAILQPISDILNNLITTYGDIEEEEVLKINSVLQAKVFDVTKPIIILFNEMDELQKLATAASLPFYDNQFLNLGVKLIKNMTIFNKGITEWYDLTTPCTYL